MAADTPVKVFISYSHDSEEHKEDVRWLAQELRKNGLEVIFDQQINGSPSQGWQLWMTQSLKQADFVLVVCTQDYYQRAMGEVPEGMGQGVKWESLLFNSHIYGNDSRNDKYVPVFIGDGNIDVIPDGLRSFSYYNVLDDGQYLKLYRYITNQPEFVEPERGEMLNLEAAGPARHPSERAASTQKTLPSNPQKPIVDLNAMPTSRGEIVGRENELKWLDDAWDDDNTRVVSVIAWGGAGKSSLINRWLNNMSAADFKGAMRVFAHSFYSQGTSEQRQVSVDHFIRDALRFFNYKGEVPDSAFEKGELLVKLFCQQRTLLILDGLEPMQYPPGVLNGKLKDASLEVLIKQLAYNLDGLCVITSRVRVLELENRGKQIDLQRLSVEAGVEVLKNHKVTGPAKDMENAVNEVNGHALTIALTGSFIAKARGSDIRKRDTIASDANKTDAAIHANKVMDSYAIWLAENHQLELALLQLIGLFDRPTMLKTLDVLLQGPVIDGLNDAFIEELPRSLWQKLLFKKPDVKYLPKDEITQALAHLHELQLIAEPDETLDCHPLVREYFANRLKQQNPSAYKQAHQLLYEYYKNLPEVELPESLEEMEPLFDAVSHGCKAGLYQQALDEVYWPRIRRGNEHFINSKLGAYASNIACVGQFFTDGSWQTPAVELSEPFQAFVLNWAAYALRALGRLHEAQGPFDKAIELFEKQQNWQETALNASNVSELCLSLGLIEKAVEYGKLSVDYMERAADESSGKTSDDQMVKFQQMAYLTTYADALLQRGLWQNKECEDDNRGDLNQAKALFIDAEKRQVEQQPEFNYLYSLQGYGYCQLLLKGAEGQQIDKVIERAETTLGWAKGNGDLLSIALDQLTLSKAYLLKDDLLQAQSYADEAVKGLRKAAHFEFLPRGLLTRARIHSQLGNHQKAWKDLAETFEVASFGDMKLHLCDYHLEVARNIALQLQGMGLEDDEPYIMIENGLQLSFNPSESKSESKNEMKKRFEQHINTAEQMINDLPYHFRDDDLIEVKGLFTTVIS